MELRNQHTTRGGATMKNAITITTLPTGKCKVHGMDEKGETWCFKFHADEKIALQSALETMKTYGRNDEIIFTSVA